MKDKSEKEKQLRALAATFGSPGNLFLTGFEKLTVQQDFELRKSVRKAGGRYQVIKNTLAERAAAGTPAEKVFQNLTGMNSLASTEGDPVALAKALTGYAKANPTFSFKAGVVEGRVIDVGQITLLATMPSRDELLAKILYLIQATAARLVSALGGVGRNLAVVLDQAVKETRFAG